MTVPLQNPEISYVEDGISTEFALPFGFEKLSDIRAERVVNGTVTPMVFGVDYSVLADDPTAGGEVVVASAATAGTQLNLWRESEARQPTRYQETGAFTSKAHEQGLDRYARLAQENKAGLDRAAQVLRGQAPLAIDRSGLQDGELLLYRQGRIQRFDTSRFAGKFFGGAAGSGLPIPLAGTGGGDAALRGDLANALAGASLIAFAASGAGAVARSLQEKAGDTVSVKDFGAVGDGVTDDRAAIVAALEALGDDGCLEWPRGKYAISAPIILNRAKNITFRGDRAWIKHAGETRMAGSFFTFWGCEEIEFEGFLFDHQKASWATETEHEVTYNGAIEFNEVPEGQPGAGTAGQGLTVRDCRFKDLYTLSIFMRNSTNLLIENCRFRCPVSTNDQWLQFIHMQTVGGLVVITKNRFLNADPGNGATAARYNPCAIYGSSITASLLVNNNYTEYCGRNNGGTHRLAVFDLYGDGQNVRVIDNVLMHSMGQHMRLSSTRGGVVRHNRFIKALYGELDYSGVTVESVVAFPGQLGCQDIEVSWNVFEDPGGRDGYTLGLLSYDWGAPATNIKFIGNSFTKCRRAMLIQGPFFDVIVAKNHARGGSEALLEVGHNGDEAANTTSIQGTEAEAVFDGLRVFKNTLLRTAGERSGIEIDLSLSKEDGFLGEIGDFEICHNKIKSTEAVDASAIAVLFNAGGALKGRLVVEGNTPDGYQYGLDPRSVREVVMRDNRPRNLGTAMLRDDVSNGTIERSGNRTAERMEGYGVLVAGSLFIASNEVATGDWIRLDRAAIGSVLGHLTYEIGSNGGVPGFWVRSRKSDATVETGDESAFFYEIRH